MRSRRWLPLLAATVLLAGALAVFGCGGDDDDPTGPPAGRELDSGTITPGNSYAHTFGNPGTYPYLCTFHTGMSGSVTVQTGAAATATVSIANSSPTGFQPGSATVAPGGTVTWVNNDGNNHTVTSP